jgi:predicted nucleic acid-binding protein
MVICDTSGLLAAFDISQRYSEEAAAALASAQPPRVVSNFVLAELDHMLRRNVSQQAARTALQRLTGGAYKLACLDESEVKQAAGIDQLYADLGIGLTDASLVVLAAKYDTHDLLSFDQRHFRKISPIQGGAFRLLPLDA